MTSKQAQTESTAGRDGCPVSEEVLGRLYRSDEAGTAEMVTGLSEHAKARLALFCYARRHMRELGLRIATQCDERILVGIAGAAGGVLYTQSRERLKNELFDRKTVLASRVTLARAA